MKVKKKKVKKNNNNIYIYEKALALKNIIRWTKLILRV